MKTYPEGKKTPDGVYLYKSPNTGEYVMSHQYLAEIIVKRKAEKEKVSLTYKYWNDKDSRWAKEFRSQVTQSATLCKKYHIKAIIKVLIDLHWCWSYRNPTFKSRLEYENKAVLAREAKLKEAKEVETTDATKVSNVQIGKKTKLARLRDL